ncbi:glycosyltransferase family 2 protein [Cystobacter fuscus]|nr:glycosyltransferase family 2 protein [Cystobacter fuscus]
MNKHPRSQGNNVLPELAVVHAQASGEVPHAPLGVDSTAEFAERVGAQFILVEELKQKGAQYQELASAEQLLIEMMHDLRRRAPKGRPSFQEVPLELGVHADIIGKLLRDPGTHRMHRLARPFQIELLRPQQEFNTRLFAVLQDAHNQLAVSRYGNVAMWIRQTLEPLAEPGAWQPQSHRLGLAAWAVRMAKRSGLELLRSNLEPIFARMRQWNLQVIDILCAAHEGPLITRAQAEQMMARLAQVADPLPPGLTLPEPLHAALLLQREFTRHTHHALERELALAPALSAEEYRQWCATREPLRISEATRQARLLARPPTFSVVVGASPVEDARHWRECVASVLAQTHDAWELCVAGPESLLTELRRQLPVEQARDSRVRFLPSAPRTGMAGALNTALSASRGQAVAFLDAADRLAPHALTELALSMRDNPTTQLFYTDEDRLDDMGQRHRPFFKPGWSCDMHRESNYASRLLVARRELCEELDGVRDGVEGAELLDFILRAAEKQVPITHVSEVLYHRRERPRAFQVVSAGAHAALSQHLSRCGEDAEVWTTPGDMLRVRHRVQGTPRVSVIVPFKDKPELLAQLWNSFREKTARWDNWQLILVSNNSANPRTFQFLDTLEDPRILKLTWNHPFNYSAINNFAARHADGELLLFLNNDIEMVDEGWMEELIAQAQRPDVGLVGPLLLFPNGLVQHAGVVLGPSGFAAHPFWRYRPDEQWTAFGRIDHTRDYLAVTSACVMVRREVFEAVGGYDERFRVSGSDVELGLRIIKRGLRCVYTPHTRLIHHESATRRLDAIPDRDAWLSYAAFRPWARQGDPFYNPHLTLSAMNCGLRTDERTVDALAVQMLAWELPATLGMVGPG